MKHWLLFALLALFSLISIITLSSIAASRVSNQMLSYCVAGLLFLIVSKFHFKDTLNVSAVWYVSAVLLLIIPLLVEPIRNTHRWLSIFGFTIQPSQLAVPLTTLFLIKNTQRYPLDSIRGVLSAVALIGIPATLIGIEPDLGTALVFTFVQGIVLFIAEIPWKYVTLLSLAAVVFTLIGWSFLLQPYQKQRVTSYLSEEKNTSDTYNVTQALIAVGSGGLYGKGPGKGSQSQLQFLPERETDFIFAAYAEEYGYMGILVLLSLYIILLAYLGYYIHAAPMVEKMYLTATFSLILIQGSIHMLMNMGVVPVTGVTLPLVSHGGSSILGFSLLLAISQSAINHTNTQQKTLHIS